MAGIIKISDESWQRVVAILAQPRRATGRPPRDLRDVFEAVLWKLRTGGNWRDLSKPVSSTTAWNHFRAWAKDGRLATAWTVICDDAAAFSLSPREVLAASLWLAEGGFVGRESIARLAGAADVPRLAAVPDQAPLAGTTDGIAPAVVTTPDGKKPKKPRGPRKPYVEPIIDCSDALWSRISPILTTHCPPAATGRPRKDFRAIFDGVIYHCRTGCGWRYLPRNYPHRATVNRWLRRWMASGALTAIWGELVKEADALGLVDWKIQAIDGSLSKARMGGEKTGKNPTDRAKSGSKRSLLVDGDGLPLSCVVDGANRHDQALLAETLRLRFRPLIPSEVKPVLLIDAGYRGKPARAIIEAEGYTYSPPPPSKKGPKAVYLVLEEGVPQPKTRRWVVERSHSWMQSYHAVFTRYARSAVAYEADVAVSAILIFWKKISESPPVEKAA